MDNLEKLAKYGTQDTWQINVREYWKGNADMMNPEKLAKYITEDEEKQSKNTTQYVLDTTLINQTQKQR